MHWSWHKGPVVLPQLVVVVIVSADPKLEALPAARRLLTGEELLAIPAGLESCGADGEAPTAGAAQLTTVLRTCLPGFS
jgi:hypothetical protein